MATVRIPVVCDCCGDQGLATVLSDAQHVQIEIRARRHGIWHSVTLDMQTLAQFDLTQYPVHSDQQRSRS